MWQCLERSRKEQLHEWGILREFDPPAASQEKGVQKAWAIAEGHLLSIQATGTPGSWPASNDTVAGQDSQSRMSQNQTVHGCAQSVFSGLSSPSLASLMHSVHASVSETVAGLASHPHSMEENPSMLYQSTISSFVAQEGKRLRSNSRPESRSVTRESDNGGGGADDVNAPENSVEEVSGETQFDFPRFPEQMKARNADLSRNIAASE